MPLPIAPPDQDRRLSAILEIATALATEQRFDSLLPRFLSRLTATLHAAETGVILVYDPLTERLAPVTALGEAMSGTALQTGQPDNVELRPPPAAAGARVGSVGSLSLTPAAGSLHRAGHGD